MANKEGPVTDADLLRMEKTIETAINAKFEKLGEKLDDDRKHNTELLRGISDRLAKLETKVSGIEGRLEGSLREKPKKWFEHAFVQVVIIAVVGTAIALVGLQVVSVNDLAAAAKTVAPVVAPKP